MKALLAKLDAGWYRAEYTGVAVGFLAMAFVVFADVVHRVAADPQWKTPGRMVALAIAFAVVGTLGAHTASRGAWSWPKRIAAGLGASATVFAASALVVVAFPNGFIWAQTVALVMTLWVGFLGASMATRDGKHLKVDAAERLFPERVRPVVGALSDLTAALFCLFLAALAVRYCAFWYDALRESGGEAGRYEALPLPMFAAFAILPITFGTIGLRFVASAVRRLTGERRPPARAALLALAIFAAAAVLVAIAAHRSPTGGAAVAIVLGVLLALLVEGSPLFATIGVVTALCFVLFGDGFRDFDAHQVFIKEIANLTRKNVLLAIPFFVVSGAIMSAGSIALRLVDFARALVGWLPGGLAIATVASCVFFAAISGSSPVTVIAIGSVMLPALVAAGYREKFSLGLLTSAGSLGIVIPPSIPMLVYALVASNTRPVDVSEMFLAGVLPGLFIGLLLALHSVREGVAHKYPVTPFSFANLRKSFFEAIWALGLPALIMGGIYPIFGGKGLFTPTEAAAVSVVYALVVELLVHRQLDWKKIPAALAESGVAMGALLLIMAMSFGLNHFLVLEKVPDLAAEWIRGQNLTPVTFLMALNVLLLVVGCLMDSISAILIIAPLLVPVANAFGLDLVHVGIVFIVNLEIGYLTPPIGINLFVASTVFQKPLGVVIRGALPFIAILAAGLLTITYLPGMSIGPVSRFLRGGDFFVALAPGAAPAPSAPGGGTPDAGPRMLTITEMMRLHRERTAAADGGAP